VRPCGRRTGGPWEEKKVQEPNRAPSEDADPAGQLRPARDTLALAPGDDLAGFCASQEAWHPQTSGTVA
jgi:hypothetical protein